MEEDIISLLDKISSINEKYEENFRKTGEKFNIFETLNLTKVEWAHSRILAELLDPKGSHGKGDLFLEKFLKILAKKHKTCAYDDSDNGEVGEFSIEGAIIQEEKPTDNGRPDIIITNKNCEKIILENKICAPEGDTQLEKYSKEKPIHLIFLTPYGKKAKKIGAGEFDYIKMSYRDDILEWLELCKKESDNPILEANLTQYILLIKQITGQPRSMDMEEEVIDAIINDSKYVSAAFKIDINAVKKRIMEKILALLKEIAMDRGFELKRNFYSNCGDNYTDYFKCDFKENGFDIWLYKNEEEWKYLAICLQFRGNGKGFHYSLNSRESKNNLHLNLEDSGLKDKLKEIEDEVKKAKESGYKDSNYGWSVLYKEGPLWENWEDNPKFFTGVISEGGMEKMKNEFRNVIKELSEIGNRLEEKLKPSL